MKPVTITGGGLAAAASLLASAVRLSQRSLSKADAACDQPAGQPPDLSFIKIELRLGPARPRPPRLNKDRPNA